MISIEQKPSQKIKKDSYLSRPKFSCKLSLITKFSMILFYFADEFTCLFIIIGNLLIMKNVKKIDSNRLLGRLDAITSLNVAKNPCPIRQLIFQAGQH